MERNNLTNLDNVIQLYIHSIVQQVYGRNQMERAKEWTIKAHARRFV